MEEVVSYVAKAQVNVLAHGCLKDDHAIYSWRIKADQLSFSRPATLVRIHLVPNHKQCYNKCIHVGAEYSFRQKDINRLFCRPTIHVRIFLIANKLATAVKSLPEVFAQAFTPARLAANLA